MTDVCPACGSEEIYLGLRRRRRILLWYGLTFVVPMFAAWPILFGVVILWAIYPVIIPLTDRWECRNCGATWPRFGTPPLPPPAPAAA
jgi:hypothetical protein